MERSGSLAAAGIVHGFGGRQGGVSDGVYATANAGRRNGDDPKAVAENRRRFAEALGATANDLATVRQVHGAVVVTVDDPKAVADNKADALVSNTPGCLVAVTTADCVPLLLADREAGIVAAVHAGWRSAHGGIIGETVAAMRRFGADSERLVAALGPAIRQDSYEVDQRFYDVWAGLDVPVDRYFALGNGPGKWQFDLVGYCVDRLRAEGISAIDDLGLDTFVAGPTYFSYRRSLSRGEAGYGVQLSGIVAPG